MITQKPLRVLIAEDSDSMGEIIRHELERNGHLVLGRAINGQEAVEQTKSLKPDIVLMDIEMPEMNGLEATQLIQERFPTPVVLLTAHDDPKMIIQAGKTGAGAYLLKPPSADELERTMLIAIARFADLLELRRLNTELKIALDNVKVLSGLLPICSNCKSIRNDKGYWEAVEGYLLEHSEVHFSHSICPSCLALLYPDYSSKKTK